MTYQQIQCYPTPEIFISGVKALLPVYTACRDEFSFAMGGLEPATVYTIDIATSNAGPWVIHCYFMLQTAGEIAAKKKTLTFNNDYNATRWFRARKIANAAGAQNVVIRTGVKPQSSIIAAPTVTVAGVSDDGAFPLDGTLRALSFYSDTGGVIPYSANELPLSFESITKYYRVSKKYAGKFISLNSFGRINDTVTGANQPITITGDLAATHVYTRDGSEPVLTTPMPSLDGVVNNASVIRDDFGLVIKARSFLGGCRSPLTIVAVDKMMRALPLITNNLSGNSVIGSCDLPRNLGDAGDPHESGQSCQVNYGGTLPFENTQLALADAASVAEISATLVYDRLKTIVEHADYLGWTNHIVTVDVAHYGNSTFPRPGAWLGIPARYNWSISKTSKPAAVDLVNEIGSPMGGAIGQFGSYNAALTAGIGAQIPAGLSGPVNLVRADIVVSILSYLEPRAAYWAPIIASLIPSVPVPTPVPPGIDPNLLLSIENWDEYADTLNADAATLDQGNGFALAWHVITYVEIIGLEDFEAYPIATVPDYRVDAEGETQFRYNAGLGYLTFWNFYTPIFSNVNLEDFESYAIGPVTMAFNGGTGFAGYWSFPVANDGIEDFELFADGYTFPANAVSLIVSGDGSFIKTWRTSNFPVASTTDATIGVAGLIANWKADSIGGHVDGDAIQTWNDSSGNGWHLQQATVANRPIYKTAQLNGKPAMKFDGVQQFFEAPSIITCLSEAELYVVFRINTQPPLVTSKTGIHRFGGFGVGATSSTHFPFTDNVIYDDFMTDTRKVTGTRAGMTAFQLYHVWSKAGDWNSFFNGTSFFATAANVVEFTGNVNIGRGGNLDQIFLDGYICEVILYDHKLSGADRTTVKAYVAAKYGLVIV